MKDLDWGAWIWIFMVHFIAIGLFGFTRVLGFWLLFIAADSMIVSFFRK